MTLVNLVATMLLEKADVQYESSSRTLALTDSLPVTFSPNYIHFFYNIQNKCTYLKMHTSIRLTYIKIHIPKQEEGDFPSHKYLQQEYIPL